MNYEIYLEKTGVDFLGVENSYIGLPSFFLIRFIYQCISEYILYLTRIQEQL